MAENEGAAGASAAPKSGKVKTIVLIAIGVLALVGVSIGATLFLAGGDTSGDEEESAAEEQADTEKKTKKGKKGKKDKKTKGEGKDTDKEKKASLAVYLPLDPPFVVNFQNPQDARFLQVSMEVMTTDPAVIEDIKKHMPAIRDSVVMLLSSQTQQALTTHEGKEAVRGEVLSRIRKIMETSTGKPGVEALYFTGFVMQ